MRRGHAVFCVLDVKTGETLRTLLPPSEGNLLQMQITPDARLVVVRSRSVECYRLQTGQLLWDVERSGNVMAQTVQFDVDGLYLSDDAMRIEKLSLDNGSTIWTSDPLFDIHTETLSTTLANGHLVVMTDADVIFLDAVNGLILREGRMLADVHFVRHFLTETNVLAIDGPARSSGGSFAAYRFAFPGRGPAERMDVSTLGTFGDVREFAIYNDAIVVHRGRMFMGWSRTPEHPSPAPSPASRPASKPAQFPK